MQASVIEEEKVLVVVFSATGTTKAVAEKIAGIEHADLYEILTAEPYTEEDLDYHDNNSRTTWNRMIQMQGLLSPVKRSPLRDIKKYI